MVIPLLLIFYLHLSLFICLPDMKFPLTLFCIFSCASLQAQLQTHVYWTQQTEMPAQEVIYYNPNYKLTWNDFEGEVPAETGRTAAITMSGFGYKASVTTTGEKINVNIAVYCYFNKPKSWVKADKKSVYILTHEQHHFDISYIAADFFMNKIKQAAITTLNYKTLMPAIYRECLDYMNKLQNQYDEQTQNGRNAEMQEQWNNIIDKKLKATLK